MADPTYPLSNTDWGVQRYQTVDRFLDGEVAAIVAVGQVSEPALLVDQLLERSSLLLDEFVRRSNAVPNQAFGAHVSDLRGVGSWRRVVQSERHGAARLSTATP